MTPREQFLSQRRLAGRHEGRIAQALTAYATGGVQRFQNIGDPTPYQTDRVRAALIDCWRDAVRLSAQSVQAEIGEMKADDPTLFERIVMEFLNRYGAMKVQQILDTTRDQIVKAIQRGQKAGDGIEKIVADLTESIPALNRLRGHIIARTEVHTASLFAAVEVAKSSPVPLMKRWVSVYDARTRDFGEGDGVVDMFSHRAMNGVTVAADEAFMVPRQDGTFEAMQFPGDPNGSAGDVIMCRCALTWRRAGRD